MLRTVFIGSQNRFDEAIVHWLAQRTEMTGVVWLDATRWQRTRRGRLRFAAGRVRRRGLLKAADEAAFHLYFHRRLMARETRKLELAVFEPYRREHGKFRWRGDAIHATDVNGDAVDAFIRERAPDAAFAMCVPDRFSERLRSIPRLGTFLWHEGITPDYRGLYSPFWALHELDLESLGCTLLRMDDRIDAGEAFVRSRVRDVDPFRDHHVSIGHKAIWESLPDVERVIAELEAGDAHALPETSARDRYFSYPGLSDYVRQRVRLRRAAASLSARP